jgi:hypothetical protein
MAALLLFSTLTKTVALRILGDISVAGEFGKPQKRKSGDPLEVKRAKRPTTKKREKYDPFFQPITQSIECNGIISFTTP